jgi:metal-sulfur cluster biosynthetic enzyme
MDETHHQHDGASAERPSATGPVSGTTATDDGRPPSDAGDLPVTEQQVLEALKQVIDPELGINIVDLGLVYEVGITQDGRVHVEYTLTTMGCPIGPLIEQQMQAFLAGIPGITEFDAEMVLRPPWSPEMMSEEAKAALGYF